MAIEVKLVLPNNLNNKFLNNEFVINDGDDYFSGKLSLSPNINENKVNLSFSVLLNDTELREQVDLKTIKTLQISNDPAFTSNKTITITDWPYNSDPYDPEVNNKVTNSDKNFIFTIDSESFRDPENTSLGSRSVDNTGTDLFIIENWPLSANGGLSTVYFKITAESTSGDQGTFPLGSGIFDQIYWQPETGVKPGTPSVITRAEGFTGKQTLFRFESAQEGASNLYGTGVSRYVADILEHRPLPNTETYYQNQFASNRTTSIYRNIFPEAVPSRTSNVATPIRRWDYASSAYTASSPTTLAINTSETGSLVTGDGIRFQLETDGNCRSTSKTPDFFAQSNISVSLTNQECESDITIGFTIPESNNTTIPSQTLQVEVKLNIANNDYDFVPNSLVYLRVSGVPTLLQQTSLSRKIIKDLADGGNLEISISKLKSPGSLVSSANFGNKFILKSYFTPDSNQNISYLLASLVIDDLYDFDYSTSPTSGIAQSFMLVDCISGEIDYTFNELAQGTGRILLDVDLGDCKTDDVLVDDSFLISTLYTEWDTAIASGQWFEVVYNNSDYSLVNMNETLAGKLKATISQDGIRRAYHELNVNNSTFSDRIKIELEWHGDSFYVGLSPVQVDNIGLTSTLPMAIRCEDLAQNSSEYINKPTVLLLFGYNVESIYRTKDNNLESKILGINKFYVPDWDPISKKDIEIYLSNSTIKDNGLWLTVKYKGSDNNLLSVKIGESLPVDDNGAGWYVSLGVRSNLPPVTGGQTSVIPGFKLVGLPPVIRFDETDLLNQRHFSKSTGLTTYQKPKLGQQLIAGNTDFRDFAYLGGNTYYSSFVAKTKNVEEIELYPQLLELMIEDVNHISGSSATPTVSHGPNDLIDREFEVTIYKSDKVLTMNVDITLSTSVTGIDSLFTSWLQVGDVLIVEKEITILSITNSTTVELSEAADFDFDGEAFNITNNGQRNYTITVTNDSTTVTFAVDNDGLSAGSKLTIYYEIEVDTITNNTALVLTDTPTFEYTGEVSIKLTYVTGSVVPNNSLVQIDLKDIFDVDYMIPNESYTIKLIMPGGLNLARAKGFNRAMTGYNIDLLWFKLFHSYRIRHDNVFDTSHLQMRVLAESHAKVLSDASGLSEAVITDLTGAICTDETITSFSTQNFKALGFQLSTNTKPVLTTALQPGVRSVILNIFAEDTQSGIWLFRIVKETDYGYLYYDNWQDWNAFKKRDEEGNLIDTEVSYTVYLYGSSEIDNEANSILNLGTFGPRRIWVEILDKVGNLSQSYPILVDAPLIALVDTKPPFSDVEIINPDGSVLDYTNRSEVVIQITGQDSVSAVKDARFRLIDGNGVGEWSAWHPYSEIMNYTILSQASTASFDMMAGPGDLGGETGGTDGTGGTGGTDGTGGTGGNTDTGSSDPTPPDSGNYYAQESISGTKRLEVQLRDYGNNALQESNVWNTLYKNTYFSEFNLLGLTEIDRNLLVVDAVSWLDPKSQVESVYMSAIKFFNYLPSQLTFEPVSSWPGEDENAYEIIAIATGQYNRKIFIGENDTITLFINDVEYNRASSATDVTVSAPKFYVDASNGYLVVMDLPGSTPTSLFDCTIYRQEAQIWRWNSNTFEKIINLGPTGERAILSMQPLKDFLLLGSAKGKIWLYDGLDLTGPVFQATNLEGDEIPITCIALHQFINETKSYIYVGTGKNAFVFRAAIDSFKITSSWEKLNIEPLNNKTFNVTGLTSAYNSLFIATNYGKVFKYNRKLNKTNDTFVSEVTNILNLSKSEIDVYESSILPVSDIHSMANQVIAAIGDRPEVHSYTETLRKLPGSSSEVISPLKFIKLTDVYLATAAPLTGTWVATNNTLTRTTSGALTIDGNSSMGINDRVLIKNQADPKQNGIYVVTIKGGVSTSTVLTRALDASYNLKLKGNAYLSVQEGTANSNKTFYLNTNDYIEFGIDNNSWSETKTSFEHYFSTWTTTYFTQNFITDPATQAWQFYFDGVTNTRNKPELLRSIFINDKNEESLSREAMSLTGFYNKATVFTNEDGSDWEQAVNRLPTQKEPFTLDFEVRHESGPGFQGFEVADGYHLVKVKFSKDSIKLQSGTSTITKSYTVRNDIFTPYSFTEQKYPQIGEIKNWNFALTSSNEDNSVFHNGFGEASQQGWVGKRFASVSAKAGGSTSVTSINVAFASTTSISANYVLGTNPASPSIGAYLELNALGALKIDGTSVPNCVLTDNTAGYNITYTPNSKIITALSTIEPEGWGGDTELPWEGSTIYDRDNDRFLGTIETVTPVSPLPGAAVDYFTLTENIPYFISGTTATGELTIFFEKTPILIKNQTNKFENGIYYVENKGSASSKAKLIRSTTFDEKSEMINNTVATVGPWISANESVLSASNYSKSFMLSSGEEILLGTTDIEFPYILPTATLSTEHYLEVTSITENEIAGDPIIGVENLTPFIADTNTYILVRLKFTTPETTDGVSTTNKVTANSSLLTCKYATRNNMTLNDVGDLTLSKWYPTDRNEPPVINDGDLILVTGQTDKTENGLYYARIGTNWDRVTPERNSIIFNRYVNVENVGVFKLSFDIDDNSWTVGSPAAEFTYTLITYENYKKIQKPTLKLRTYWSSDSSISNLSNYTYHSIDFNSGTNYETVLIKPSWVGPVRSLYFEFSNLKNTGYNAKVQIDYISVLTNAGYYNVKKELTPVRIALSGDDRTDVRLWVGNFEDPIIEIDNFAIQETSGSYIRFGKLTPDDEASSWIWGSLRYHIGNVIPPVVPEQVGFYPSFRFPSVGGVRKIVQHAGTVWCLTDGYYNNATTDNPDDKIFKAWSYIPDKEIWKLESPIPNRISTTKGVTRALAAASYRNTLIVSGQVETIIDESIMPVENP